MKNDTAAIMRYAQVLDDMQDDARIVSLIASRLLEAAWRLSDAIADASTLGLGRTAQLADAVHATSAVLLATERTLTQALKHTTGA